MLMDEHLGRMAAVYPDETAFEVVDVGGLTFAEWDGAANALARRLVDEGIAPDDRVGIHLHPERRCSGSSATPASTAPAEWPCP